nr:hypothetical protein [Tanacetum cinerariifolium]
IYKEGRKSFFIIIKADGNSQSYLTFGKMFKCFNREDLEVLWSIVKARFQQTKPMDNMDNMLFQTLKIMFEHHVEDNIWKYQQVEKMYPFTRNILHQMWNDVRLQFNYELEMVYDLLRLIRLQLLKEFMVTEMRSKTYQKEIKNDWRTRILLKIMQSSSAVASLFLSRGNLSSLAVGKYFGSGNSSLVVGMP